LPPLHDPNTLSLASHPSVLLSECRSTNNILRRTHRWLASARHLDCFYRTLWTQSAGRHFPKPTPTRSAAEFADYLLEIVARFAQARTIHLVLDNLNTHRRKSLTERYGEKLGGMLWDRFTVHYTPKHGSWLNQAEIEVSLLSRQCLGRRRIPNIASLGGEVLAWGRRLNRNHTTIEWNFTRKQVRRKLHYSITKTRY
jgi:transposase